MLVNSWALSHLMLDVDEIASWVKQVFCYSERFRRSVHPNHSNWDSTLLVLVMGVSWPCMHTYLVGIVYRILEYSSKILG